MTARDASLEQILFKSVPPTPVLEEQVESLVWAQVASDPMSIGEQFWVERVFVSAVHEMDRQALGKSLPFMALSLLICEMG